MDSPPSLRAQSSRPEEYTFSTLAGPPESPGAIDGTGHLTRFHRPSGVAADSAGNVYVADTANCTIRKITPGGVVTTLAGNAAHASGVFFLEARGGYADGTGHAARFNYPEGVAVDSAGNVYVADTGNHTIRKVTPAGAVTTLAGNAAITDEYGSPVGGYADGTGSAARFKEPRGVAVDSAHNLYVADSRNCTVRKVTPAGVVTTLAGCAGSWGSADGIGSAARFGNKYNGPSGVAVDNAGNVYVADTGNDTIRKVTPEGVVTTLADSPDETGSLDGRGWAARFNNAWGLAMDDAGNLYVADSWNNTIRKVTPEGVVTTLAGLAEKGGSADGPGNAARFCGPRDVAVDGEGNIYVADTGNSTIRKVTPRGVVTTLAGLAGSSGHADGTGSAARFGAIIGVPCLMGLALDRIGRVYVADTGNCSIRVGTPITCPDQPTTGLAVAPAGLPRQLDTRPQTAIAWQWSLIRQPAASTAALSDAHVRNPTFTPDVADLYVFRLKATNAAGAICIRTLELTAVPANVAMLASPQRLTDGSLQFNLIGQTNRSYTLQVSTDLTTWTDWTKVIPTSSSTLLADPAATQESRRFYRAQTR